MEWVAVAVNIARDPSVHRMAGALKVRVPEVVGLLTLTFAEMTHHAPTGEVGEVPDSLLETWSGWHGKKGAFAEQFRANLCNDTGLVLAWERYNGANLRRAKAASERSRTWRERKENADSTHTRTHTERIRERSTRQDKTGQDRKREESGADAPAPAVKIVRPPRVATSGWASEGVAWWVPTVGAMQPARFSKALAAVVAVHGWPLVFADLQKWVSARTAEGKPCRLEWYAEAASARISTSAAAMFDPVTRELTPLGERMSRPERVSA